nr:hypothetical protein [uncultured Acidocella sp.]
MKVLSLNAEGLPAPPISGAPNPTEQGHGNNDYDRQGNIFRQGEMAHHAPDDTIDHGMNQRRGNHVPDCVMMMIHLVFRSFAGLSLHSPERPNHALAPAINDLPEHNIGDDGEGKS